MRFSNESDNNDRFRRFDTFDSQVLTIQAQTMGFNERIGFGGQFPVPITKCLSYGFNSVKAFTAS